MVDGADAGVVEGFDAKFDDSRLNCHTGITMDFRNADMVCIEQQPISAESGKPEDSVYRIYGIYKSNIVTSHAKSSTIASYSSLWKDKSVLVFKKPYILNGDNLQ
jgi:hypothetical protein